MSGGEGPAQFYQNLPSVLVAHPAGCFMVQSVKHSKCELSEPLKETSYAALYGNSAQRTSSSGDVYIPKGSNVVPFLVMTCLLPRDRNILPKKELH